ncbi:hypothetical protein RJ641_036444 [Dillenia turbinata]|uniref:Uncharacterized protein n=1 Tax=Dillenia turbinata TaxID=194707 RepID=A0AAN8VFZ2_9MAGN
MAGNVRFESSSGSPEEPAFAVNYPNGQRGNYSGATLDRSGSFRESSESRLLSSGTSVSRINSTMSGDSSSLSQCLLLEPIMMAEQKFTLCGEVRRVLGLSIGSSSEDNSFGAAHSKPPPPVATEELKRFKASVVDARIKARARSKRLDESLHRLESLNSKKHQRNEPSPNERSGGPNLVKIGNQIHQSISDFVAQRSEDRTKNIVLNKRVHTSVAETRAEGRSNIFPRQPLVVGRDRDMLKDGVAGSDLVEEKIRRLPAGGEGWDKKMKRKRSVGAVFSRPMEYDGELKRSVHHKLGNELGLQLSDAHGFRSGSLSGINGTSKLDGSSLPGGSGARMTSKNELDKVSLARDPMTGPNKDRVIAKGNIKLAVREDNHIMTSTLGSKAKASRGPRTAAVTAANSSPNFLRTPAALEGWEQSSNVNKTQVMGGPNSRKRPMPTGSSSPPMAQWVGQRPQKISRTRRANLVSPVSNLEEVQISSEACSPDFGARMNSSGMNGSLLGRNVANGNHQIKMKLENVSSLAKLSESEESGAGENKLKDRGSVSGEGEDRAVDTVQNVGPSILISKKNKIPIKEEIGDGIRRQGRSGRGSPFSRTNISPLRDKLENPTTIKPHRGIRPGPEKNGSKSGRPPLKKMSDRKAVTRLAHTPNSVSPDLTGESEDDREELLAAANFACNASYLGCSGPFWKKMESFFGYLGAESASYLKDQLNMVEELHEGLSQGNPACGDSSNEHDRSQANQIESKYLGGSLDLDDQLQDICAFSGRTDSERRIGRGVPLYQRVLSALIVEDETEENEEHGRGRNISLQYARDGPCLISDVEPKDSGIIEYVYDSKFGFQTPMQCTLDRFTLNGNITLHSEVGMVQGFSYNDVNGPQADVSSVSPFDCPYEQMDLDAKVLLELQSNVDPEIVPDLAEGEDEAISQEIFELKKELCQQVDKKKAHLDRINKLMHERKEMEGRELEQVAMDRLIEMAYKKLLASRGSGSKGGVSKVSKQTALAFAKRTLTRCQKFEETGISCFSEPALRDVILAPPSCGTAADFHPEACRSEFRRSGSYVGMARRLDLSDDKIDRGLSDTLDSPSHSSDHAFAKNGPISNRGKKKEVLLDDVGGSTAIRTTSALGNSLLGGAKGKRSDRDRDKVVNGRNSVGKAGRPSLGNFRGERKNKSKPKQKTAQLSNSGNGFVSRFSETTPPVYPSPNGPSVRKQEVGLTSPLNMPPDLLKDTKENMEFANFPMPEFESIEELGVASAIGGPQDLGSWLNFDEDGLQDHDSMGLEIPMDDLSDLNMLLYQSTLNWNNTIRSPE